MSECECTSVHLFSCESQLVIWFSISTHTHTYSHMLGAHPTSYKLQIDWITFIIYWNILDAQVNEESKPTEQRERVGNCNRRDKKKIWNKKQASTNNKLHCEAFIFKGKRMFWFSSQSLLLLVLLFIFLLDDDLSVLLYHAISLATRRVLVFLYISCFFLCFQSHTNQYSRL